MDRRTLFALALMLVVAVLPSILWPPEPPPEDPLAADTTALVPDTAPVAAEREAVIVPVRPALPAVEPEPASPQPVAPVITVSSDLYAFTFSAEGGRLVGAVLRGYETFAAGDSGRAQLMPPDSRFLEYALVVGADTLSLADWVFEPSHAALQVEEAGAQLGWTATRGAVRVELTYAFRPDHYLFDITGHVTGVDAAIALVNLGPRLALVDADSVWDFRSYSVVTKAGKTERLDFRKIDPLETRILEGPFEWVAVKSKYFVVAALALEEGLPRFGGARATAWERVGSHATHTDVVASLPAPGGRFHFSLYVGPQEYHRLRRIGHALEDINPYGWVLRPIIQPVANLIVVILLWAHETLALSYGWVLVLFGIAVRIVLWPVWRSSMRSTMAMQAIQPELKAVQERYKKDPQRMQQEVMKLYKEHKVNPLGGCLPMLIPMPVLFALFFVFRETIAFRGVPFLWLPDLSRADPYYIIPVLMGLSMFAVSKIGQIGIPPNPQTKMMTYFMPIMLTVLFFKFSSGLNLYYAVSNIASIPQQWMIAQERRRHRAKRE